MTQTVQVRRVIDPQTIQIEDGTLVRMTGIDFPDFNPYKPGDFSLAAVRVLKDMLEKKTVNLYQTQKKDWGRSDRMANQLAQVERKDDKAWVQGTLLQIGLARTMTELRNPEMAEQLLALEQKARAQKAGVWKGDSYRIISPDETPAKTGTVQIVEGTVISTAQKDSRIYLNFGKDWRTDFTVTIPPERRRDFSKLGIDPLKWTGETLRVRGWIGDYNGPFIEVDHPQRIEILTENKYSLPLKPPTQGPMLKSNN